MTNADLYLKNGKTLKGFASIIGGKKSDTNNRKIRFKKKMNTKEKIYYDHTKIDSVFFKRKDRKGKSEWTEKYLYIAENKDRILLVKEFSEEIFPAGKAKLYLLDFNKKGPFLVSLREVISSKKRTFLLIRDGEKYATRIVAATGIRNRNLLTEYFSDCYSFAEKIYNKEFEKKRIIDVLEIVTQYNEIANDCGK